MSTRTETTYDDATTTSPRTDFSTDDLQTDSSTTSDAPNPHSDVSWTDRCKRQFATTSTTRMRNLNDDANASMHDGV